MTSLHCIYEFINYKLPKGETYTQMQTNDPVHNVHCTLHMSVYLLYSQTKVYFGLTLNGGRDGRVMASSPTVKPGFIYCKVLRGTLLLF